MWSTNRAISCFFFIFLALTSSSDPILEIDSSIRDSDGFLDNRTGVALAGAISLECSARNSSESLILPAPQWLKNGEVVVEETNRISLSNNGDLLAIMNFVSSDAGVYQCLFTDTDGDAEILATVPFRLDTGSYNIMCMISRLLVNLIIIMIRSVVKYNTWLVTDRFVWNINTIFLQRRSPEVIFLRPPEKLVIEVVIAGRYWNIQWLVNGVLQTITQEEYPNYNEIYVKETTQESDIELYEVDVRASSVATQRISPSGLDFFVIAPGKIIYVILMWFLQFGKFCSWCQHNI